jgi:hypothetical protein
MAHVSYSKLRDNLAAYMDEVCNLSNESLVATS